MKTKLIALGVITLTAAIGYGLYYQLGFFATQVTPKNGSQVSSVSPVVFKFNKPLSPSSAKTFSINPQVQGQLEIKGNQLIFTPAANYRLNQEYRAVLTRPTSVDGKALDAIVTKFTAKFVPYAETSDTEKNLQVQTSDSLERSYPIVRHLPHETLQYKIDYRLKGGDLVLQINLFATLNRPDQYQQYKQEVERYRKEALDYIRSIGEDPTKYKIEYNPPL